MSVRVFDIGPMLEQIETFIAAEVEAISRGIEPDPVDVKLREELVELLAKEGPGVVERFWDSIDMTEGESKLLATRIKELQERKASRDKAVERMKGVVKDLLNRHFNGKIKTATITTWTQKTPVFTVNGADYSKHPQYYKTLEPEFKKSIVLEQFKAGVPMPEGIEVVEGFSESVRVKR